MFWKQENCLKNVLSSCNIILCAHIYTAPCRCTCIHYYISLLSLTHIPFLSSTVSYPLRLQAMEIRLSFEDIVEEYMPSLEVVKSALDGNGNLLCIMIHLSPCVPYKYVC